VAGIMRELLAGVVDHGTGITAKLDGFSAAGKTGTAQKIDSSGRYSRSHYVASFVGFAPVERPAITILVVIDSPVGQIYGTEVAAPAFRTIAEQTLGYLNVPQESPSHQPLVASSAPARSHRQAGSSSAGPPPHDSERAVAATSSLQRVSYPSLPALLPASPRAQSNWPADQPNPGTVLISQAPLLTVPDFTGWPVRRVAERCLALGLELNIRGTGLAINQNPIAGATAPAGSDVVVQFSR